MQNVVLGAYAYDLTHSATFVGVIIFAQLGPTLILPMVGGLLADKVDRKRFLIVLSIEQLVFSLGVALVALVPPSLARPARASWCSGSAWAAPCSGPPTRRSSRGSWARRTCPAPSRSNSAQMNASRVIGPVIGGVLYSLIGPAWVFAGNAATYLFVVAALMMVTLPAVPQSSVQASRWHQLTAGITVARQDPVVGRCLVTVFLFSLLALAFIGQMPVVAAHNLGINLSDSPDYGILYACFGFGALTGAISIGTVFARTSKPLLVRVCLVGYSLSLCVFALERETVPAYVNVAVVGRVLLRVHHRAEHDAAGTRGRERAGPGHGAVDDGLRRHGRHRQPAHRAGGRGRRHHRRPALRRRRRPGPGLVRRRAAARPRFRWCWAPELAQ